MLNGYYTVNQGRRILGLPEFTDPFADRYVRLDRRGYWFLK